MNLLRYPPRCHRQASVLTVLRMATGKVSEGWGPGCVGSWRLSGVAVTCHNPASNGRPVRSLVNHRGRKDVCDATHYTPPRRSASGQHRGPGGQYCLCGDFRFRPFWQLDFKGGQDLPDEQIMSYQGSDL
jgi:hypothetical protein